MILPMIAFFPSRTVALELFGFAVHWYGIMYLCAFLLAWFLLPRLQKYRSLTLSSDVWSTVISWAVLGVVFGGRLGFIFFYDLAYYLQYPLRMLAVWEGGMSFHGGFIGATLAIFFAVRNLGQDWLRVGDIVVIPVAIGLAFGRIGNFINQELYGPVTALPWGIAIPDIAGLRHPTQLYAVFKDLFIALCCFLALRAGNRISPGRVWALFMMLYGILRFCIEFLRVQEFMPTVLGPIVLTRGQVLSIPVFILGLLLWLLAPGISARMMRGAARTDRAP